jgi:pimeloyl-ACP methyl ester carboxylesterase
MEKPAMDSPPVVRTDIAIRDVGTAMEFIRKRRGANRIALIGWSWGATIAVAFTVRHRGTVSRLVLCAPQWLRDRSSSDSTPLGAYSTIEPRFTVERAQRLVPADKKRILMPDGWIAQFEAAALAADPEGAKQKPAVVRYPSGPAQDGREYWAAGKPYYDPSDIDVPVLVAHAEWDANLPSAMARAIFERLTSAPVRRLVEIGEGTHLISIERNRLQLFREVQSFLDEPSPGDPGRQ